ncbi:hypothetical protein ABFV80_002328 [Vandammella animalimorsus]|uniref:hypothetical protein n=1 Tax=Vandammella animalimorsus TaxID=2029117 RepID=UPI00325C1828
MARPPKTAQAPVDVAFNEQALAQASAAATELAALQAAYGQERDLLNQLLGQAQMADAVAKLTATVAVSKMAYVKEHKLYRQLAGMKNRDGRDLNGTWEEFCQMLGTSAPKVNEDITNLQAFGEEALESMSRMGIGYRELRQYRRLPEDQKQALIEVAKAGDKEGFVELAEELIAKHAKEKESLSAQAEEARAELAAKEQLLAGKNSLIDALASDLARASQRLANLPADQAWVELQREATGKAAEAAGLIAGSLRHALQTLHEAGEQMGRRDQVFMAGLLGQVEQEIHALREQFALPLAPAAGRPEWQQWADAQDAAEAAEAAAQAMDAAH